MGYSDSDSDSDSGIGQWGVAMKVEVARIVRMEGGMAPARMALR